MTNTINPNPLAETRLQIREGRLTSGIYLEQLLERFNDVEPAVQAFIPEVNRQARLHDTLASLGNQTDLPLYAIPVGVKDIFHVDGFTTLAGTSLPPELFNGEQATVVTKLKNAGALIAGKTVTTEFAYFEPGPTRNPHNLAHTPGGSSSGSAAAVAAGLCTLAIGTQTVGSVIRPAAYCGIIGFKPSYGRIDPTGVIFVSPSLDHVGLFTQDVAGMQLAASVVCDGWNLQDENLQRPTLGIPEGAYLEQASAEGLTLFKEQVTQLENAGYTVKRVSVFEDITTIAHYHIDLMAYEMAGQHRAWFEEYETVYRPRTRGLIQRGLSVSEETAQTAREMQIELRTQLHELMNAHGIDLWISPAAPGTAPEGIQATGDPAMNLTWTNTGLPTVTVPAGMANNGLPVGLQCSSAFMTDEKLLAWAEKIAEIFRP